MYRAGAIKKKNHIIHPHCAFLQMEYLGLEQTNKKKLSHFKRTVKESVFDRFMC